MRSWSSMGSFVAKAWQEHAAGKLNVKTCVSGSPPSEAGPSPPSPSSGECADDNAAVEEAAGAWGTTECSVDLCEGQYADMMRPLCMKTCGMCSDADPDPE